MNKIVIYQIIADLIYPQRQINLFLSLLNQ